MRKNERELWQVGPTQGDDRFIELYDGGPVVAAVFPMGADFDGENESAEREEHARLVAAAPAMAHALEAIYYDIVEDLRCERHAKTPDLDAWLRATGALLARLNARGASL